MAITVTAKDKPQARILELVVLADESADTFLVSAVNYYRTKADFDNNDPLSISFAGGAAAANCEVEISGVIAPPTIIRLESTFQA